MNLLSTFFIGILIAGSLGANALGLTNHQPKAGQSIESIQTISEQKAIEIALGETKGGMVTKSRIEEDNGIKKYKITIIKRNEKNDVEISATTGEILDFGQEISLVGLRN